ncbi:unnamed protein product, partial [Iphiclides podalirius]
MISICDVIVTLCVFLGLASNQSADASCGSGSTCINIRQCPGIFDLLVNDPSNYLPDFITPLICENNRKSQPKICCPTLFNDTSLIYNMTKSYLPSDKICGIQSNDRIVGGQETELDEHPWLVLIRYDKPKGWGFYCAGVLITSRHVLTAAHCLKGADLPSTWKLTQVRLGEWNISSERDCLERDCTTGIIDVEVAEQIPHEAYDKSDDHQQNDIAILKLARDVPFNDFIRPICLPLTKEQQTNSYVGYDMEVAGWGKTETKTMSEVKLKAIVPVVNSTTCANVYKKANRRITEKQICAGGQKGVDSCRGDSGGALMGQMRSTQNWIVVGVVSYGPTPCGTPNWPGVYTRVGSYIDWIKRHLN